MKKGAIGVAMTLALLPAIANAIVIDFEGLDSSATQPVPLTSFTENGLTFGLSFTGPNDGPAIFDTTCANFGDLGASAACNGDDDLLPIGGQPMAPDSAVDFDNGVAGNVLILQETGSDIPDDQAPGGTIIFSSALSNPAFFLNSFWAIDDGMFTIMAGGESASVNNGSGENVEGQAVFSTPVLINPGENFTLTFSGSGAIDNLSVTAVPVPPAALLLLGALGGLAVIRRKRRADA